MLHGFAGFSVERHKSQSSFGSDAAVVRQESTVSSNTYIARNAVSLYTSLSHSRSTPQSPHTHRMPPLGNCAQNCQRCPVAAHVGITHVTRQPPAPVGTCSVRRFQSRAQVNPPRAIDCRLVGQLRRRTSVPIFNHAGHQPGSPHSACLTGIHRLILISFTFTLQSVRTCNRRCRSRRRRERPAGAHTRRNAGSRLV